MLEEITGRRPAQQTHKLQFLAHVYLTFLTHDAPFWLGKRIPTYLYIYLYLFGHISKDIIAALTDFYANLFEYFLSYWPRSCVVFIQFQLLALNLLHFGNRLDAGTFPRPLS